MAFNSVWVLFLFCLVCFMTPALVDIFKHGDQKQGEREIKCLWKHQLGVLHMLWGDGPDATWTCNLADIHPSEVLVMSTTETEHAVRCWLPQSEHKIYYPHAVEAAVVNYLPWDGVELWFHSDPIVASGFLVVFAKDITGLFVLRVSEIKSLICMSGLC